jgi:hypothetical protein
VGELFSDLRVTSPKKEICMYIQHGMQVCRISVKLGNERRMYTGVGAETEGKYVEYWERKEYVNYRGGTT